ncbi:MAG: TIGR01777 family protein [Ferrovum sp.]|nr:TIGR01777 family protein [Ferrovum sp.]
MKILVVGGAGLLGEHLVRALMLEGHTVTILSRRSSGRTGAFGEGVRFISSLEEWGRAEFFDTVINLAGAPIADYPWTAARQRVLWQSRVELTEKLVDKFTRLPRPPTVLISASAIGYYQADSRGDSEIDERGAQGKDFSAHLCRAWESAAQRAQSHGTRVCVVRTGLVLTPQGGVLSRLVLPGGWGLQAGEGHQGFSWIHVADWVRAVEFLMASPRAVGPYNLTAPQFLSQADFMRGLRESGMTRRTLRIPAPVVRFMLGKRATLLLEGVKAAPAQLLSEGFQFEFPELCQALGQLRGFCAGKGPHFI